MVDISSVAGVVSAANGSRALVAPLTRSIQGLRNRQQDAAPGDVPTRTSAYLRFQESAIQLSLDLQLLAEIGLPPGLVGAAWTWPSAFRAFRRIQREIAELSKATFGIGVVGSREVLEVTIRVGEALAAMASRVPEEKGPTSTTFQMLADDLTANLAAYADAARSDLRH